MFIKYSHPGFKSVISHTESIALATKLKTGTWYSTVTVQFLYFGSFQSLCHTFYKFL